MTSAPDRNTLAFAHGFVRRIVLPIAILIAILVPSFSILQSASLPDLNNMLCQMHLVKSAEPPSDIVFFGSSRTGAGIDVVAVAATFDGRLETAEKFVLTRGAELDRNLAYRTYVNYRGTPKVLAIELSFERRKDRIEEQETPIRPSGRTATLFEMDVYQDLLASLRSSGDATLTSMYFKSTFQSVGGYFFERLGVGADQALRSPSEAIPPTDECVWKFTPRRGRWVVGDSMPFIEAEAKVPSARRQKRWTKAAAKHRLLDFEHPWTQQEMMYLEDMVDTAYANGVETVILYYLPSFQEQTDVIDLEEVQIRIPEATIFDGRTVLNDSTRPSLQLQYRDGNHLNKFAAYEISVAIAAFAEEEAP